jgi:hypothetical protein
MEMKALFNNNRRELEAAAKTAGLIVVTVNIGSTYNQVAIFNKGSFFAVVGSNHAVMRIIGALANDGQDTLRSVEG